MGLGRYRVSEHPEDLAPCPTMARIVPASLLSTTHVLSRSILQSHLHGYDAASRFCEKETPIHMLLRRLLAVCSLPEIRILTI